MKNHVCPCLDSQEECWNLTSPFLYPGFNRMLKVETSKLNVYGSWLYVTLCAFIIERLSDETCREIRNKRIVLTTISFVANGQFAVHLSRGVIFLFSTQSSCVHLPRSRPNPHWSQMSQSLLPTPSHASPNPTDLPFPHGYSRETYS